MLIQLVLAVALITGYDEAGNRAFALFVDGTRHQASRVKAQARHKRPGIAVSVCDPCPGPDLVRNLFTPSSRPAKAGREEARPAGGATGAVLNRANREDGERSSASPQERRIGVGTSGLSRAPGSTSVHVARTHARSARPQQQSLLKG